MQLQEFFDYKNRLMEDMMTTESIVKLIDGSTSLEGADSLIYKYVFPYEYVPETIEEAHTYVCCDVDIMRSEGKMLLQPVLYIWVFTHKSLLRLPEGGVRTDKLASEICKKINGSRYYGLGELNLYSVKRFAPMTDYNGKQLIFHAKDFNRQYDGTKPVPNNRRAGI